MNGSLGNFFIKGSNLLKLYRNQNNTVNENLLSKFCFETNQRNSRFWKSCVDKFVPTLEDVSFLQELIGSIDNLILVI